MKNQQLPQFKSQQISWLNRLIMDSCKTIGLDSEYQRPQQPEDSETIELERHNNQLVIEDQSSLDLNASNSSANSNQRSLSILGANEQSTLATATKLPDKTISDRPYDIIIFAAYGSVGSFLVEELALVVEKYYYTGNKNQNEQNQSETPATSTLNIRELRNPTQFAQTNRRQSVPRHMDRGIKWAIAGRSAVKLSETLCKAELSTGIKDLSIETPVILADLNHHLSIIDMTSKANVVVNCAGPYSDTGEILIKACLNTRTDYIDLSHESKFIERMRQKYSDQASKAGVHIINGCGFQSMSAEMGLNFIKQVVDGQIDEVKIILNLSDTKALFRQSGNGNHCGIVTYGQWRSLLSEKSSDISAKCTTCCSSEKIETKWQSSSEDDDHESPTRRLLRKDTQTLVKDIVEFRNRDSLEWLQIFTGFEECGRKFCLPTNTLTSEESQLIRGEMANYEYRKPDLNSEAGWRPIRCTSFMSLGSFVEVIMVLIWLILFNILAKFSLSRGLLSAFPYMASLGNVRSKNEARQLNRDSLNHIKFCQTLLAYGTPGDNSGDPLERREKHLKRKQEQLLVARVVGPEPNHIATATFAIQAALALVLEKDHLPTQGGVSTPGAAFAETNIIYQLRKRNIKFEVLKKA